MGSQPVEKLSSEELEQEWIELSNASALAYHRWDRGMRVRVNNRIRKIQNELKDRGEL